MYSDSDICDREPEDNFAKELQQYIQAKEMAKAAQSLPVPEEPVEKERAQGTQKGKGCPCRGGVLCLCPCLKGAGLSCTLPHYEAMGVTDLHSGVSLQGPGPRDPATWCTDAWFAGRARWSGGFSKAMTPLKGRMCNLRPCEGRAKPVCIAII